MSGSGGENHFFCGLQVAHHECRVESRHSAVGKAQHDALFHQHEARKRQSDARSGGFGGEEGQEYFASCLGRDGVAIVADGEGKVGGVGALFRGVAVWREPAEIKGCGSGFVGIFRQVDDYLSQLVLIGAQGGGFVQLDGPCEVGLQALERVEQGVQAEFGRTWGRDRSHLSEVAHKAHHAFARVVNGSDALFIGRVFQRRVGEVGLRNTADGGSGIHDFVGEHSRQALPRLHLLLRGERLYVSAEIVERLLQSAFAPGETFRWEAEGEVAVADGFAHQVGAIAEQALVLQVFMDAEADEHDGYCSGYE